MKGSVRRIVPVPPTEKEYTLILSTPELGMISYALRSSDMSKDRLTQEIVALERSEPE